MCKTESAGGYCNMVIHVVAEGDTVNMLAARYGVTAESIELTNQLQYPYYLVVGQALLIENTVPGEAAESVRPTGRSVYINGFAYPFISRWVLNATLPYLTFLSVFSYGFTPDGDLVFPALDDTFMIAAAGEYRAVAALTLTPFGEDGNFNNNLIHSLLRNEAAVNNLTEQLKTVMSERGFGALDVDFEFILPEDRDLFTDFVAGLTEALNPLGFQVFVDLAPKTSADQRGLLYEGKDYGGLGAAANGVLLMTYEWGYAYGPPMAVAPVNQVRRVVEYALTEIPANKISLGIPNYGYDWTLPYVRGGIRARTIGNVEAVQLAAAYNAVIEFDETAKSPFFFYYLDGVQHVVWFEDVRSLNAKFDLIEEFGLRGAGYWTIMQWFQANWTLLNERFSIIKIK